MMDLALAVSLQSADILRVLRVLDLTWLQWSSGSVALWQQAIIGS